VIIAALVAPVFVHYRAPRASTPQDKQEFT
jgi:hypothetical protein